MKYQSADQLVDVSDWQIDSDFSPYPEGSRTKSAVFCPTEPTFPFLIGGHRYLFKLSNRNFPAQFWAEIVAFHVGSLVGVSVPPAFAAIHSQTDQNAALIEWFYGPKIPHHYIDDPSKAEVIKAFLFRKFFGNEGTATETVERYVSGGQYMARMIPNYDLKKGRQHNVTLLMRFSGKFEQQYAMPNPVEHWAKVFLFDALIGNTDRHQDNWGIIWYGFTPDKIRAVFAPAFDNGTSLGHEIMEENLPKFANPDRLQSYVERGTHHIRFAKDDPRRCQHRELIEWFKTRYPKSIDTMKEVLSFDFGELERQVIGLTEFDVSSPLSEERADFILRLIKCRRDKLLNVFEVQNI